jgi:hypothetical protein
VPQLWPGDLVIWDTLSALSAHKRKWARLWVEAAGAEVCFLPPYSPDFNPIEPAFRKLKGCLQGCLRRAEARTRADLDQAMSAALATITSQNARAWFAHCGYREPGQLR